MSTSGSPAAPLYVSPQMTAAMAALRDFAARLPPEFQTDFDNVVSDLEAGAEAEADAIIDVQAKRVPVVGGIAASIIKSALQKEMITTQAELDAFVAGLTPGAP